MPKRSKSLTGQVTFRRQNTSDYFVPKRWKTIVAFIAALAFSQIGISIYKADEPHSSVFALQEHHSFPFPLHNLSSFKENTKTDFRSTIPSITTRKMKFLSASLRGLFLDHWICHSLYFNHRLNNDVSSAVDLFPQNRSLLSCTCKSTESFDSSVPTSCAKTKNCKERGNNLIIYQATSPSHPFILCQSYRATTKIA